MGDTQQLPQLITPRRASRSITLVLIGSIGILWGFKSCTRRDEEDEKRYASTRPSVAHGGSGYYDPVNHYWHSGYSGYGSTHAWGSSQRVSPGSSSGFSSHGESSGTSRGGFGSIGHGHGHGGGE